MLITLYQLAIISEHNKNLEILVRISRSFLIIYISFMIFVKDEVVNTNNNNYAYDVKKY